MTTDTLGGRLREALSHWGQGHHAFARRLKELEITGAAYRSVVNYLGDRTSPSKFWIRTAADILGVSETWLGADEGQMLPDKIIEKRGDPNVDLCFMAMDDLKPDLAKTAHVLTLAHLMLTRDRFEDVYGNTRGMSGPDIKRSYPEHLLLPLKALLLHVRGSDQLTDVGPEVVRQALTQYLELVLLLMPAPEAVGDEDRKAVSRCLSEWVKKQKEEGRAALEDAVRSYHEANPDALRKLFESNPKTEEA